MNPSVPNGIFGKHSRHLRLPFLGLMLPAAGGLLLGAALPGFAVAFLVCALGLLLLTCIFPRPALLWAGVLFCFATLQAGGMRWSAGALLESVAGPLPRVVEMFGTVAEPPVFTGSGGLVVVRADRLKAGGAERAFPAADIVVRWPGPLPGYGQEVVVAGSLRPIPVRRNPGAFDTAAWLGARGIFLELRVENERDVKMQGEEMLNPWIAAAARSREWISGILRMGLPEDSPVPGVLQAMTLGDTSGLTEEWKSDFRVTGTLHLFSVSGLHVGMLGVIFWLALRPLPVPFAWKIVLLIGLLFFYAAVTGLRPPSLRAAFMASVVLAGFLVGRPAVPFNSLAAAAFGILLFDPSQLFNPGFQLSFLVVGSILLFGVPFARWFGEHCGPDPFLPVQLFRTREKLLGWFAKSFGGAAAVSFAAWLGSLPLVLVHYHLVSLIAIPANILAVPLAFVILATGILATFSGLLSAGLVVIFNNANLAFTSLLLALVAGAAEVPGGYFRVGLGSFFGPQREVVVFDAGAGASMVLREGGTTFLVDTGSERFWKNAGAPFLESRGCFRLAGLFLTHGDSRHVGGAKSAIQEFAPGFVAVSALKDRSRSMAALFRWMEEHALPKRVLVAPTVLEFADSFSVEVLYPPAGLRRQLADDKVLVLRWQIQGLTLLFLSDGGVQVEEWLMENAQAHLNADVLVTGRHVDGLPGSSEFLDAVSPSLVISSAVDFPRVQKIPATWEKLLAQKGIPLMRQDQTGAVRIRWMDGSVEASGFLGGTQQIELPMDKENPTR